MSAVLALVMCASAGCGSGRQVGQRPAATAAPSTGRREPPCSNDAVTASVLADLAVADGRASATELPGYTFYGNCGATRYAVAALVPGPLATQAEMAAFGSGDASAELFTRTTGSSWTVTARAATGSYGCASLSVPTALRDIWGECAVPLHPEPAGPAAQGDQTRCRQHTGSRTFVRLTGVEVHSDGSATLQGVPDGVHCGGPDDYQFADSGAPEVLHLLPGAPVGVFELPSGSEVREPIGQLASYLQHPELGIFQVYGATPNLVTGIAEQFHP